MKNLLKTFTIELKNHNYARNTIKAYRRHIQAFIAYSEKNALLPEKCIPLFLNSCSKSFEQKRIAMHAIKLFYRFVIKKECPYSINQARRRKRLPVVLTKHEILSLLA